MPSVKEGEVKRRINTGVNVRCSCQKGFSESFKTHLNKKKRSKIIKSSAASVCKTSKESRSEALRGRRSDEMFLTEARRQIDIILKMIPSGDVTALNQELHIKSLKVVLTYS